ncbi:hypothetical protein J4Q44_G00341990 [Coregonus suidteri]|uniref:Uncharacterized protein n=1 Tax=Coregonus suidteri TaxID=861788 RepID=A0AAN8KPG2_9TELE
MDSTSPTPTRSPQQKKENPSADIFIGGGGVVMLVGEETTTVNPPSPFRYALRKINMASCSSTVLCQPIKTCISIVTPLTSWLSVWGILGYVGLQGSGCHVTSLEKTRTT